VKQVFDGNFIMLRSVAGLIEGAMSAEGATYSPRPDGTSVLVWLKLGVQRSVKAQTGGLVDA